MKSIDRMKELLEMCGIKYFIQKFIKHSMPIFSIRNKRVRSILWYDKCLKKISKYIEVESFNNLIDKSIKEESKIIWVLWLQGKDNMPLVVKKCYESVLKNSSGYKVVLLNKDNLNKYIQLPDYIEEKFKKGFIKNAIYSDIIRITLLAKYGGVWIDSTVYLTDEISNFIKKNKSEVFFYQSSKLDCSPIKISNWFIFSRYPNNFIIEAIKNSIYSYWKYEKYLIDYNIFHLIVTALLQNDQFKKQWDNIPYICNMNPHVMQFSLNEKYTQEKWDFICRTSPIHKLTWKIDNNNFSYDSIFCKIIKEGCL